MRKLTNKFKFVANDDKTEVTINFYEVYPIIPDEAGEPITTQSELATSLVMSEEMAKELARNLLKILEEEEV